ncbi:MAG: hypothetical protein ACE5JL_18070 [Dehalococcoidia bacterium]
MRLDKGVVFISPWILAVYQVVISNQLVPRGERDESGAGGKYILHVVLLDTKRGEEVQTLRFITGASDLSGVYPTHDGRFLVKTQGMLRLYSTTFEEIASRPLPLSETASGLGWILSVSPSGKLVYAKQSFRTKHYLFDADTLETIPNPRPSDVAFWPEARYLLPELVPFPPRAGVFTPQGNWMALNLDSKDSSCIRWGFVGIGWQDFGGRGCKHLKLFSADGRLFWDVPVHHEVGSFILSGSLLVAKSFQSPWDPFDLLPPPKRIRVVVYDLATKSEKCSIRITDRRSNLYALSPAGTVAVIQGNVLSLYRP